MIGLGNSVVKRKLAGASVPAAPINIIQPSLSGSGAVGEAVICNKGTWSGSPTPTYTYDFRLDSVSVQNSSSNSYTPLLADDGKTLTCLVTATNSQGSASEGTSNSIVIGIAPSNTIAPTLSPSGTQSTGTVITVGNGTFSGTAPLTYAYRWKRNGSIILGETANTYTIVAGDDGTVITAEVKATNAYGESAYIGTSNQVDAVNAIAPVNTAAPVVSGTAVVGQTLSTTNGTWTGIPTPTFSYQWYRGATLISGATNSTYTLVQADAGNASNIKCTVSAINSAGSASADSNTVAQILDANMKSWLIDTLGIQNNSTAYFTSTRQRTGAQLVQYYNTFFIGLKSNNIYSAIRAMYRPRFADANLNKFNMVNPADTNAAYRMVYSGTWAYNETGEVPNGTNASCNTNLAVNVMAQNSLAIGVFINVAGTSGNRVEISNTVDSTTYLSVAYNSIGSGQSISNINNAGLKGVANGGIRTGFWVASRTTSTERVLYRDATLLDTFVATSTTPTTGTIQFGRGLQATEFSDRGQNFRIVSDGLSGTQISALTTLLSTLTTSEGI